jgi:hypothetical protein
MKKSSRFTILSHDKYSVDDKTYVYDYMYVDEMRRTIINYSDQEFLDNIPKILHFTCFMSFILDIDSVDTLSDVGVIHELVHLLSEGTKGYVSLDSVRDKFELLFGTLPKKLDIQTPYTE